MFGEEQEEKPSFPKVLDDTVTTLETAITVVMGHVSVCWSQMHSEGVFQSDRALAACEELAEWIKQHYRVKDQADWENLSMGDKLDIIHRLEMQTHALLHTVAQRVGVEGHHG